MSQPSARTRTQLVPARQAGVAPFAGHCDIHFFFGGAGRGAVVDGLTRELRRGAALLRVVGETGSGKSFLSRVLAERLRHRWHVLRVCVDGLDELSLLRLLMIELGTRQECLEARQAELLRERLREALMNRAVGDKPCLLIIDAGSRLEDTVLERLQALGTEQPDGAQLFQSVVFEPAGPSSAAPDFVLQPLQADEVRAWLHLHMMLHDYTRRHAFDLDMATRLCDSAGGNFARLNVMARQSWLGLSGDTGSLDRYLPCAASTQQTARRTSRSLRRLAVIVVSAGVFGAAMVLLR